MLELSKHINGVESIGWSSYSGSLWTVWIVHRFPPNARMRARVEWNIPTVQTVQLSRQTGVSSDGTGSEFLPTSQACRIAERLKSTGFPVSGGATGPSYRA